MTDSSGSPFDESPSLQSRGGDSRNAFELKFLVEESTAWQVEDWARRRLSLDRYGDPDLGGAYRTTSLYFDTPELDVYHRSRTYRRRKFRIRRYGKMPWVFLERKTKSGDRVSKRRSGVPIEEIDLLVEPTPHAEWSGGWFHRRLMLRRLVPASRVQYERTAFVGACTESPLRLTLDRRIRGVLAVNWDMSPVDSGLPLLTGKVIVELKFLESLPGPFKSLVADMKLAPHPISKYRLCREAWGVSPIRGVVNA